MNEKTVLVIDDSNTIRKLVDCHLSSVGYQVVLAPNAEDGLQLAPEVMPDLILLDHQLPGTTGHQVATQLAQTEELKHIPVVISSTLRKKAYVEYVDLDNVVDMLPKPYTEELLETTVANAIETARMIVDSQSQGSAVPEIINALNEAALNGSFSCFGLREMLDFLNNGRKAGVLEVQMSGTRIRFHLANGRIQGVNAQGLSSADVQEMVAKLPESLANLAPIMKMTISGQSCTEIDGFVQLLNQKVLDPRLMAKLLRFQSAQLVQKAFESELSDFHFEAGTAPNALHLNLPLDISLLALLVEGALFTDAADLEAEATYARVAIRGQNLDRAGLSARHLKLLNLLAENKTVNEMLQTLGWDNEELSQVLKAFERAEQVEKRTLAVAGQFVVYEPNATAAQQLRQSIEESDNRYSGKVVRDKLGLQMLLKRTVPHTIVFASDDESSCELIKKVFASKHPDAAKVKRVALQNPTSTDIDWNTKVGFTPEAIVTRPCTAEKLFGCLDELFGCTHENSSDGNAALATAVPAPVAAEEQEFETTGTLTP